MRRRKALKFTLMTTVVGSIVLCLVALGCGPAAPAGRGGALGNPFATAVVPSAVAPTAVLPAGADGASVWDGTGLPPPPTRNEMQRRYPNLGSHLIRKILEYESAAAAAAEGAGEAASSGLPAPTPEVIELFANIDAHDHIADVRHFLEENGALRVRCVKFLSDYIIPNGGQCAAFVQVSLLRGLAELPGVIRVEKIHTAQPASELILPLPSIAE